MPIRQRYRNRRAPNRGRPKNIMRAQREEWAPRGPRGANGTEGCIKIVVGRARVRIWNNCGEPITVEDTLQLNVVNIYVQRLSGGGKAVVVFGDPAEEVHTRNGRNVRGREEAENDYGDIPEDVEEWI